MATPRKLSEACEGAQSAPPRVPEPREGAPAELAPFFNSPDGPKTDQSFGSLLKLAYKLGEVLRASLTELYGWKDPFLGAQLLTAKALVEVAPTGDEAEVVLHKLPKERLRP